MRTPLKNVRHLGSAKEGTDHFWRQRMSAVALLILTPLFVAMIVFGSTLGYADIKQVLRSPIVTMLLALYIGAGLFHMRLGMQTIIEDYVHSEGKKIVLLMLNTFFVILLATAAGFALLKLALNEF